MLSSLIKLKKSTYIAFLLDTSNNSVQAIHLVVQGEGLCRKNIKINKKIFEDLNEKKIGKIVQHSAYL